MSLLSCSHTLGPIIFEATPRCVKKGGSGQMWSLLGINCRYLVSPSDHFAYSVVVPMAIPHEGLTSRGTVYSNCSLWVYCFSLVGPSLSWGELGTMSLFEAASKMPVLPFSLYSIILCLPVPLFCPAYCITSVWVQGMCELAAMRLWWRTPAWWLVHRSKQHWASFPGTALPPCQLWPAPSVLSESLSAAQAGIP